MKDSQTVRRRKTRKKVTLIKGRSLYILLAKRFHTVLEVVIQLIVEHLISQPKRFDSTV